MTQDPLALKDDPIETHRLETISIDDYDSVEAEVRFAHEKQLVGIANRAEHAGQCYGGGD